MRLVRFNPSYGETSVFINPEFVFEIQSSGLKDDSKPVTKIASAFGSTVYVQADVNEVIERLLEAANSDRYSHTPYVPCAWNTGKSPMPIKEV